MLAELAVRDPGAFGDLARARRRLTIRAGRRARADGAACRNSGRRSIHEGHARGCSGPRSQRRSTRADRGRSRGASGSSTSVARDRLTEVMRGVGALPAEERPAIGRARESSSSAASTSTSRRFAERWRSERRARALAERAHRRHAAGPCAAARATSIPCRRCSTRSSTCSSASDSRSYEGPEIEDEHHNFDGAEHSAPTIRRATCRTRSSSTAPHVLRTHTSPVQIRVMENQEPPIAAIVPGTVYRHEVETVKNSADVPSGRGVLVDGA